ncbi:MAG: hypothetical protein E4H28_05785 [Gemmatimonadales bacterium]|nr:MAG: hypothetical protein E4H28_05785 [Gemmatimonadales bacterium]
MKILKVHANRRLKAFEIETPRGNYTYPFAKAGPGRGALRVAEVYVDEELGGEAFTYCLDSGEEETVHVEQVLDYNQDPEYLKALLLYKLTLEAVRGAADSGISKRELARRLGTSPSQLYRLLDSTNSAKSVGQMLALLHLVGREVDVVVKSRRLSGAG